MEPAPLPVPTVAIRLLLVVDGYFSLGAQDRNDRSFSVSKLIALLKGTSFENGARIYLDTAHRDGDQDATIWGKFKFDSSVPDLSYYDEIWMFGYNGFNKLDRDNIKFHNAITPQEIDAITKFMQNGGGVLADGDHDSLGSYMCGRIPRVRNMRKWFAQDDDQIYCTQSFPDGFQGRPCNWPARGPGRADTLQKDLNNVYNFTNQSDDIPQPLTLKEVNGQFHPILLLKGGRYLDRFPDHFHEGEVLGFGGVAKSVPWSMDRTIKLGDGSEIAEFPKDASGNQEKPNIIATGHVIGGHETLVEQDKLCDSGFRTDTDKTIDKHINILSVYDGHRVDVGRILTDSSFHHFVDLNLIGDPCASEEKTTGFNHDFLKDLSTFYVNCAMWLANKRVWDGREPPYGLLKTSSA